MIFKFRSKSNSTILLLIIALNILTIINSIIVVVDFRVFIYVTSLINVVYLAILWDDIKSISRASLIDFASWIIAIIFSSCIIYLIFGLINTFFNNKTNIHLLFSHLILTLILFLVYKFFQILYFRLQDFNIDGKFLLGIIPIISFYFGFKLIQEKKYLLAILMLFNFSLIIPYLLFFPSNMKYNYFGIHPAQIRKFNYEKRQIEKSKSLTQEAKLKLIEEVHLKYKNVEIEARNSFIKKESTKLLHKESIKSNQFLSEREAYFKDKIESKIKCNLTFAK